MVKGQAARRRRPASAGRTAGPARSEGDGTARERILASAYTLFSRHGIRKVGIEAIISHSGVARMTLYRNFASKDDLVLAFLERREQRWTKEWLQSETGRRASTPQEQLLAIFDLFDGWFRRGDFEGCSFINVLLEASDPTSSVHKASARHLGRIRSFVERLAKAAGIKRPAEFAHTWHILMKGSIVAAREGDRDAARRARAVGALLLRTAPLA